ncbi:sensor domain-containing diguanylate cyclase [uncultured Rhodoferax sp.]|uniref:GGDEF domain-containing protein n=1 Tax=uncultured Rhodoferax sp. TaxID=223188 RepID=UPI0025F9C0F5|nr:sensor domain-containing diguanylate cyclase [uncultured Rhodoferax sp.]
MLLFKPKNHPYSLRRNLRLLVFVCVLPATLVSAWLTYSTYEMRREQLEQQIVLQSRTVLAELDRDMAAVESGAKVLARAPELAKGDLRSFYLRASEALAAGFVYNYILTDTQGRQVLNTLRPWGTPLPMTGTPAQLGRVFSERATVLTDLFVGPVARRNALALGVPVLRGDEVVYSLNIGLDPIRVQELLTRHQLPQGWVMAVLDGSGHIVARSRDASRYIGQLAVPSLLEAMALRDHDTLLSETKDGEPVFTAYSTSGPWRWRVVVGAPRALLLHDLMVQLGWVLGGSLLAYGLGLWLARAISLRVLASVQQLNAAAQALCHGQDVQLPAIRLQEAEAVGAALQQASMAMKQVTFYAQHDVLTGLPNRLLFDEVAERNLAFAERRGHSLAVVAVDLDGFKTVNDTQGHATGDEVLKAVAQRIQAVIRASDIVARLGGDEFIVLLSDVEESAAMDTARRMVQALSEPYPQVLAPVSASVGVALYPRHGLELKSLVQAADRALYRAKQAGKRCATLAG